MIFKPFDSLCLEPSQSLLQRLQETSKKCFKEIKETLAKDHAVVLNSLGNTICIQYWISSRSSKFLKHEEQEKRLWQALTIFHGTKPTKQQGIQEWGLASTVIVSVNDSVTAHCVAVFG